MPNYHTHHWLARKVGVVVGVLLAIVTFIGTFDPIKSIFIGLVAYMATIVGGVAPDIDLSQSNTSLKYASIPYRKLVELVKLLIVVVAFFLFLGYASDGPLTTQVLMSALIAGSTVVLIRAVPDILHAVMPGHRKLTHKPSFWGVMSILGVVAVRELLIALQSTPFVITYLPLAIGVPIFLGVVTHVSLDIVNNYVRDYAPDPVKRRAAQLLPWVPKHKPVIADIPQLARIALDGRAPWTIRLFVVFTALYGLLPLDLIPDGLLGIGWVEDLAIYLNLRGTVYSGYHNQEGIVDSIRRRAATLFKIYLPTVLLILAVVVAYFTWFS